MKYLTSRQIAKKWRISERSVRNYCILGRVPGAIQGERIWLIPENVKKPIRQIRHANRDKSLLEILREEKASKLPGRIYHTLQIEMTYNSNHIEGSKLTHDQTRYIFETHTVSFDKKGSPLVNDIIETVNHFRCIDLVIDAANYKLSEAFIKQLHFALKVNTIDAMNPDFNVGAYKKLENIVGGIDTIPPERVSYEMTRLLKEYNEKENITVYDIIDFHKRFESIHPFQDGNGRVGRLIMLKECLKHNIVPILITDQFKDFYYRGLKEYKREKGYLIDTCLNGQDIFKKYLDYFHIKYNK